MESSPLKPQDFVKTKLELARVLGVSRPTLDRWVVMPAFPPKEEQGWPVAHARMFAAIQQTRDDSVRKLEMDLLREQVAQAQMRTGREADELMPVEWVKRVLAHQAICFRQIIQGSGLSVEQMELLTTKVEAIDCDDFLSSLAEEALASA